MEKRVTTIAVLGASGLIGEAVASQLRANGFQVVAIARRFTKAQKHALPTVVECPIVDLPPEALRQLFERHGVDIAVNCIGVLQDSRKNGSAQKVHCDFVARLIAAANADGDHRLLIHISVPGRQDEDRTAFSATKRKAEGLIATSGHPFVILRPGFVLAPAAYGGSALIRAFAALPFAMPSREFARPFAATDIGDIGRTIAIVARRWAEGKRDWRVVWDVMETHPRSVGGVVSAFADHLGGPTARLLLPSWLMRMAAAAGDLSAHFGWSPPIRTTALVEMRRGVRGDPQEWAAATGIEPASLDVALARAPSTVQERWFARLYLTKALIIGSLAVFWIDSGLISLALSFDTATAILTTHGFPARWAQAATLSTSLLDIFTGVLISIRRTCRFGLISGIVVSLFYMVGAAVIAPVLWIDPLGALVKTAPAIVLMLVALAIFDDR